MVAEMKKGNIPCMDVDNMDEFNWVVKKLEEYIFTLRKIFLLTKMQGTG